MTVTRPVRRRGKERRDDDKLIERCKEAIQSLSLPELEKAQAEIHTINELADPIYNAAKQLVYERKKSEDLKVEVERLKGELLSCQHDCAQFCGENERLKKRVEELEYDDEEAEEDIEIVYGVEELRITADYLKQIGARESQVKLVRDRWPDGLLVNEISANEVFNSGLDAGWIASRVLIVQAVKRYWKARVRAVKVYECVRERAETDYVAGDGVGWDVFEDAKNQAETVYYRTKFQTLFMLLLDAENWRADIARPS